VSGPEARETRKARDCRASAGADWAGHSVTHTETEGSGGRDRTTVRAATSTSRLDRPRKDGCLDEQRHEGVCRDVAGDRPPADPDVGVVTRAPLAGKSGRVPLQSRARPATDIGNRVWAVRPEFPPVLASGAGEGRRYAGGVTRRFAADP